MVEERAVKALFDVGADASVKEKPMSLSLHLNARHQAVFRVFRDKMCVVFLEIML